MIRSALGYALIACLAAGILGSLFISYRSRKRVRRLMRSRNHIRISDE